MELKRLLRILRSRWAIVALIALVGFVSAFGLTALAGGDAEPVFQASVAIQFELQEEETVEDLNAEIEAERGVAVFATQDLIQQYSGASVFADPPAARLVFVARGSTSAEAVGRAQELVAAYLESDASGGSGVSGRLAELERQAVEVQAEIDALQPSLTPDEQSLKSQHDLIDRKIVRIEEEILALTVASAGASQEEQADIAERIVELEQELVGLGAEKATLPPAPSEELSAVDQLRLDSLTRILEFLKLEHQRYAMRTFGITGTGGTVQPPSVADLTPQPPNPLVNGAIGLMGGAGIALLALVLTTRARREIWLESDVPLTVLGTVPTRVSSGFPGPSWYDVSEGGPRKESIQALRSAIEGSLDGPGSSLAIVDERVGPIECHTLAADVGAAFASAGQRVLLIDADFTGGSELREFRVGDPTLESFLRLPGISKSLPEQVSGVLENVVQIRPGLAVIPSGAAPVSPADALAAPQFRVMLEQVRRTFDLVVVVAGPASSPSAQVISQRVGAAMIAVAPGKTTTHTLERLVTDLRTQRVNTLGAVVVSGTDSPGISRLRLPSWARATDEPSSAYVEHTDPVSRLRFYPFPGEKGLNPSREGSLRSLVGDLSEVEGGRPNTLPARDDELASDLLGALGNAGHREAYEPVAEYVVARVEDVLTAVSGQENLSQELVEAVVQDGYIPLKPVRGHRTVGEWLIEELRWELGEDGERVAAEFARLLGGEDADGAAATLDSWLAAEFFPRHIERTQGEPEVWHVASAEGTLHALVYGRRLSQQRLDRFITNVVRRAIDGLQRQLEWARRGDDLDEVERLEVGLRDLHLFEVGLGMLQVGSSERARIHYPWRRSEEQPNGWAPIWAEGIRPNIAPLQRLGLLAHPVLSDEELITTQSAV